MKKIALVILTFFLELSLTGCMGAMTPSEKVENLMNRYIKNDQDIVTELDTYIKEQNLTYEQKERYKKIILNEYATIEYKVKNESIVDDEAKVEVDIVVKDLYKASKDAGDYLVDHVKEFYENDVYDENKFIDYKLETMEKSEKKKDYTIYIDLVKKEGNWIIEEIDEETLEKIHGIYDYEPANA